MRDGNVSAAAKTAGIDRKTFHRLVSRYHLRYVEHTTMLP